MEAMSPRLASRMTGIIEPSRSDSSLYGGDDVLQNGPTFWSIELEEGRVGLEGGSVGSSRFHETQAKGPRRLGSGGGQVGRVRVEPHAEQGGAIIDTFSEKRKEGFHRGLIAYFILRWTELILQFGKRLVDLFAGSACRDETLVIFFEQAPVIIRKCHLRLSRERASFQSLNQTFDLAKSYRRTDWRRQTEATSRINRNARANAMRP